MNIEKMIVQGMDEEHRKRNAERAAIYGIYGR